MLNHNRVELKFFLIYHSTVHKDHALKKYRIEYLEKESSVFILFIYM